MMTQATTADYRQDEPPMFSEIPITYTPQIINPPTTVDQTMSQTIGRLALALSLAQGSMAAAKKDSANPFFKSKYADLSSVWEACRKPLADNQLAVIQTTRGDGKTITIITTLVHSSGEWIRGEFTVVPTKSDAQGLGSSVTYARRYGLSAIIGGYADDDDGESAVGRKASNNAPASTPREAPTGTTEVSLEDRCREGMIKLGFDIPTIAGAIKKNGHVLASLYSQLGDLHRTKTKDPVKFEALKQDFIDYAKAGAK